MVVCAVATLVRVIVVSFALCNVCGQVTSSKGGYRSNTRYFLWLYSLSFCEYCLLARTC